MANEGNLLTVILQSSIQAYLRQLNQNYYENRLIPWINLQAPLWTRRTEVVIGRRPYYENPGYGPYQTIPAEDYISRQKKYFIEKDVSINNGVIFKSILNGKRNFDIHFNIKCNVQNQPDTAEVTIYNIDDRIRHLFSHAPIVIRSGYEKIFDVIFLGHIEDFEPEYNESGSAVKLTAQSDFRYFMGKGISRVYPVGSRAITIIMDLLQRTPIPIGYVEPTDYILDDEQFIITADETIGSALARICKKIKYGYNMQGSKIYLASEYYTSKLSNMSVDIDVYKAPLPFPLIKLDAASGLLKLTKSDEAAVEDEESSTTTFTVTSLLIPHIIINSILDVRTRFDHELVQVKELEFKSSETAHYATAKGQRAFIKEAT